MQWHDLVVYAMYSLMSTLEMCQGQSHPSTSQKLPYNSTLLFTIGILQQLLAVIKHWFISFGQKVHGLFHSHRRYCAKRSLHLFLRSNLVRCTLSPSAARCPSLVVLEIRI